MATDTLNPLEDTFITTSKACRLLGVSKRTILNWLDQGWLKAWSTEGGHHRIPMRAIQGILEKRRQELLAVEANPLTLLWVEDDTELLAVFCEAVASWPLPIRLVTADNGFDGLLQAGLYKPEVIIADLSMPSMDGFQMIHKLRDWQELKDTLLMVVTALTDQEVAERGGLPQEVPLLHKPAPFKRIRAMIEERFPVARRAAKLLSQPVE